MEQHMITEETAAKWLAAKHAEQQAKDARIEIESEIIDGIEIPDGKKSVTTKIGPYKVRVGTTIGYSFAPDFDTLPEEERLAVADYKPTINEKRYLALSPDMAVKYAKYITAKPRKPSVCISEE